MHMSNYIFSIDMSHKIYIISDKLLCMPKYEYDKLLIHINFLIIDIPFLYGVTYSCQNNGYKCDLMQILNAQYLRQMCNNDFKNI